MDKRIKKMWIKDLKTPGRRQTTLTLERRNQEDKITGHCCLGRLCVLAKKEVEGLKMVSAKKVKNPGALGVHTTRRGRSIVISRDKKTGKTVGETEVLPRAVQRWAGLRLGNPSIVIGKIKNPVLRDKVRAKLRKVAYAGNSIPLAVLNDRKCTFKEIAEIINDCL